MQPLHATLSFVSNRWEQQSSLAARSWSNILLVALTFAFKRFFTEILCKTFERNVRHCTVYWHKLFLFTILDIHTGILSPELMCPSSWNLNLDDFPFFGTSVAHLEPHLASPVCREPRLAAACLWMNVTLHKAGRRTSFSMFWCDCEKSCGYFTGPHGATIYSTGGTEPKHSGLQHRNNFKHSFLQLATLKVALAQNWLYPQYFPG